jgi:hypothetical protein
MPVLARVSAKGLSGDDSERLVVFGANDEAERGEARAQVPDGLAHLDGETVIWREARGGQLGCRLVVPQHLGRAGVEALHDSGP